MPPRFPTPPNLKEATAALPSVDKMLDRIIAASGALGQAASGAIKVTITADIDPDGDGFLPAVKAQTSLTVQLRRGALSFTVDGAVPAGADS